MDPRYNKRQADSSNYGQRSRQPHQPSHHQQSRDRSRERGSAGGGNVGSWQGRQGGEGVRPPPRRIHDESYDVQTNCFQVVPANASKRKGEWYEYTADIYEARKIRKDPDGNLLASPKFVFKEEKVDGEFKSGSKKSLGIHEKGASLESEQVMLALQRKLLEGNGKKWIAVRNTFVLYVSCCKKTWICVLTLAVA
jgi:hypothetical protein